MSIQKEDGDLSLQSLQGCSVSDYKGLSKELGRKSGFLGRFPRTGGFNWGESFLFKGYNPRHLSSGSFDSGRRKPWGLSAGRVVRRLGLTSFWRLSYHQGEEARRRRWTAEHFLALRTDILPSPRLFPFRFLPFLFPFLLLVSVVFLRKAMRWRGFLV